MSKTSPPAIKPTKQNRFSVRFKLYRVSTASGTLDLSIASSVTLTSIKVEDYDSDAWTDIETYVEVYSATDISSPGILFKSTSLVGTIRIADVFISEQQVSSVVWQMAKSAAYTLKVADIGSHVYISTGGVTIPNNADSPIAIGGLITVINNSGSTQTISKGGSVTLYIAGDNTSKSSLTLAARGMVTFIKVATDTWLASGNVS